MLICFNISIPTFRIDKMDNRIDIFEKNLYFLNQALIYLFLLYYRISKLKDNSIGVI